MFLNSLLAAGGLLKEITNFFFNFSSSVNTARTVMLWVAIALTIAFIATKFALPKERQPLVNKIAFLVVGAFAACSIVLFSTLNFIDDEMTAMTFYPLLVCVLCFVAGGIAITIKPTKTVKIISFSGMGASFIAVIVCMLIYQLSGDAAEVGGVADSEAGLYISSIALVAAILIIGFFADKNRSPIDARTVAFAGMCVTLSFALSYIRIFKMPMGGSITFASWLPIMLFSFMFGSRKGLLAGLIFGILQAIQDPWIIHPAQFALDYAIAFTSLGLTGCVRDFGLFKGNLRAQFALGAVVATVFRFTSAFFSGVFAFGSYGAYYADKFAWSALANPYFYSFIYQCMYIIPELIIVLATGMLLFSSKNFTKSIEQYSIDR